MLDNQERREKLSRYSFTALPLQLITWLGIITLLLSIVLGLQTLWQKWQGEAVEGFTTVILVQLGVRSVLIISLGLIGEYLARIYGEIKNRSQYIITVSVYRVLQMRGGGYADVLPVLQVPDNKADAVPCERLQDRNEPCR